MRLGFMRAVVLAGAAALTTGAVAGAPTAAATPAGTVLAKTGALTTYTGTVPAGTATVTSITVRQDLQHSTLAVSARWSAGTVPKTIAVGFGRWNGKECDVDGDDGAHAYAGERGFEVYIPFSGAPVLGQATRAARSVTASLHDTRIASREWTCAIAAHRGANSADLQRFSPVSLASVRATPRLSAKAAPKKRVVRGGTWVKVKVTVRNSGTGTASRVRVRVAGSKRVKVKGPQARSYGSVVDGTRETKVFKVRTTRKGRYKVTVTVRSGSTTLKRTVVVVRR
ncbi:hypothetical protein FE697_011455 [Mumia zhuanghuii]|uniref:CARDB protein n=2 Tax=Mumia TaxID=1546255 RepID=A0ABW1QG77_9ACTN|nr:MULTISPECIES: hypothetical protein [Mumia]KAA1422772.1 hypothetical protein FE697_011455 [Mumia zhuanghuii]